MSGPDAPKLDEPSVKPRFINGPGPCVDYVAMNTQKITDPDVRHAIALAIDRQTDSARVRRRSVRLDRRFVHPAVGCGFPGAGSRSETPRRCRGREEAAGRENRSPIASGARRATQCSTGESSDVIKNNLKAAGIEVVVDESNPDDYTARHRGRRPAGHLARRVVRGLADSGRGRACGARSRS